MRYLNWWVILLHHYLLTKQFDSCLSKNSGQHEGWGDGVPEGISSLRSVTGKDRREKLEDSRKENLSRPVIGLHLQEEPNARANFNKV